jgi:hypothetical protein
MPDKRVAELVKLIRSWDGWRLEETGKAWVAYPPDRALPAVNFHKTPSDQRWYANTVARLRRSGGPI